MQVTTYDLSHSLIFKATMKMKILKILQHSLWKLTTTYQQKRRYANNSNFAGVHGREWVAPAMALYLIHRLTVDPTAFVKGGELDGVDWYILPLVNPDGYEYTRSSRSVSISVI